MSNFEYRKEGTARLAWKKGIVSIIRDSSSFIRAE